MKLRGSISGLHSSWQRQRKGPGRSSCGKSPKNQDWLLFAYLGGNIHSRKLLLACDSKSEDRRNDRINKRGYFWYFTGYRFFRMVHIYIKRTFFMSNLWDLHFWIRIYAAGLTPADPWYDIFISSFLPILVSSSVILIYHRYFSCDQLSKPIF